MLASSEKTSVIPLPILFQFWLVAKLKEEYGEERAQAIFESLLVRNKASIRVTDLGRKEEIQVLLEASDSPLSVFGLVKEQGHFAGP